MKTPPNVEPLFQWLVDGAPGARGPDAVVGRLGVWLEECGVPVSRVAAFVRTLHPHFMGRSFLWRRGAAEVVIKEASYAVLESDEFRASPVGHVYGTGQELRCRITDGDLPFTELVPLRKEGVTDYVVMPLRFIDGQVHAIVFSTDAPGGFTDHHLAALRYVVRPLSRLGEILALRRTATNLLNAYLGRDAGERILAGRVRLGDTESIRCVIWFSDLRGFTSLSAEREPSQIIQVLNRVFDCQVPAIERNGGEVLKFMGDGLLAIFPFSDDGTKVADGALVAVAEALSSLAALNVQQRERGEVALDFGVALHVGDVAYGNIGGKGRLDFTCIGPAVNLAARIEGLTGKLGRRLLVSDEFAKWAKAPLREVGAFELKGVAGATRVFEPATTGPE